MRLGLKDGVQRFVDNEKATLKMRMDEVTSKAFKDLKMANYA